MKLNEALIHCNTKRREKWLKKNKRKNQLLHG